MKSRQALPIKFAAAAVAITAAAIALVACSKKEEPAPAAPAASDTNMVANPDDALHPHGRGN